MFDFFGICCVLNCMLCFKVIKINDLISIIIFGDLVDCLLRICIREILFIWRMIFLFCKCNFYIMKVNIIGINLRKVMFCKIGLFNYEDG